MNQTKQEAHFLNMRQGLRALPRCFRTFFSLMLCLMGFCYLSLIFSIWQDTGLSIATITEAYGSMEAVELTQHTFQYMYWFVGIFSIMGALFFLTENSEKVKSIFAVLIPTLIFTDIGSTWLISHYYLFSWILFVSGLLLAACFLWMFLWIQKELWRAGAWVEEAIRP